MRDMNNVAWQIAEFASRDIPSERGYRVRLFLASLAHVFGVRLK